MVITTADELLFLREALAFSANSPPSIPSPQPRSGSATGTKAPREKCNPPEFSPSKRFAFLKLSLRWPGAILRKLRIECASGRAGENTLGIIRLEAVLPEVRYL